MSKASNLIVLQTIKEGDTNGKSYTSRISEEGRFDLLDWISYWRRAVGQLQKTYSPPKDNVVSRDVMDLKRVVKIVSAEMDVALFGKAEDSYMASQPLTLRID